MDNSAAETPFLGHTLHAGEAVEACPICNATERKEVLRQPDEFLGELCLVQCMQCEMVYLASRLSFASVIQLENESELYTYPEEVAEERIGILGGLVTWLESYVGKQKRLLDVGCSRGLLLAAAKRRGWDATGVEISSITAERARRDYSVTVYDSLEAIPQAEVYDAITLWHVLEHTTDPIGFLRSVRFRLADGGVIALQVPAYELIDEYRGRDMLGGLLCAVHNLYFTKPTLEHTLTTAGYHVVEVRYEIDGLFLTAVCLKQKPRRVIDRVRRFFSA